MAVDLPSDLDPDEVARLLAEEREYSQSLQRAGKWTGLWRVVGQWANYSIFEVADNDELHEILSGLPLFPHLSVTVTALSAHPSRIDPSRPPFD